MDSSLGEHALVTNRALFDAHVFTPLEEAVLELQRRRANKELGAQVVELLRRDIPKPFMNHPRAVTFRQITTPNYETRRFFSLVDAMEGLDPLFIEYLDDKFVSCNEIKHALGKMFFYQGVGKKGGTKIVSETIINFNEANGKKLREVKTVWGESLVHFHHEFFCTRFRNEPDVFFDASDWFLRQGSSAEGYYAPFLSLFLQHGILFEDFLLNEEETEFTRNVFLPAFSSIHKITGYKPLIVNLAMTDIEGARFWKCYPYEDREYIIQKLPGKT